MHIVILFYLMVALFAWGLCRAAWADIQAMRREAKAKAIRIWGMTRVHMIQAARAAGLDPDCVMDLRSISQPEWQPFANVIQLGPNFGPYERRISAESRRRIREDLGKRMAGEPGDVVLVSAKDMSIDNLSAPPAMKLSFRAPKAGDQQGFKGHVTIKPGSLPPIP